MAARAGSGLEVCAYLAEHPEDVRLAVRSEFTNALQRRFYSALLRYNPSVGSDFFGRLALVGGDNEVIDFALWLLGVPDAVHDDGGRALYDRRTRRASSRAMWETNLRRAVPPGTAA